MSLHHDTYVDDLAAQFFVNNNPHCLRPQHPWLCDGSCFGASAKVVSVSVSQNKLGENCYMNTFAAQRWHCPSGWGQKRSLRGIPRRWLAPPTLGHSQEQSKSTDTSLQPETIQRLCHMHRRRREQLENPVEQQWSSTTAESITSSELGQDSLHGALCAIQGPGQSGRDRGRSSKNMKCLMSTLWALKMGPVLAVTAKRCGKGASLPEHRRHRRPARGIAVLDLRPCSTSRCAQPT